MSGTVAIGNKVTLDKPIHDLGGTERGAGEQLRVEQVAHEHTNHPIILATPVEWVRDQVTHRTAHEIRIGGEYCFYLDDLRGTTWCERTITPTPSVRSSSLIMKRSV